MLRKPDNNWVLKQENEISSVQDEFVCCSCIMMTNQKKRSLTIKRRIDVSPFAFHVFGSDRNSGLGLWESLNLEIERYQLKSSLEFEIMA